MNKKLFRALCLAAYCLLPTAYCLAQGTPGTVRYPTLLDTPDSLFRIKDSSRTTLTSSINSSVTSMTVASTSTFADSGSLKIGDEIVYYTSKTSTQFLGLVRGSSGTAAASHNAGSSVFAPILAAHHNTLADAIVATQTKLGQGASVPALNSVLVGTGAGSSVWSAQPAIDCTNCTNVPAPANLNASNLTSGTVPDARFPGTLPAVSGANLTGLTKTQVGLSSVDNTSDAAKPVSTAQQTALDLKANIASPTFTGTPAAPTAAAGTNTTQIATTAHVFAERSNTATLTNKTISGASNTLSDIGNASLTNSSVTIGSTSVSLGGTAATVAGLTLTTPTIASFTNATHNHTNAAGGGQLTDSALSSVVSLGKGGTGVALTDPNADRLLFWDDSAGTMEWLTLGTNLSITGTTLNAAGGSGSPGGADTQVQFNDGGAFGGDAGLTYDKTTDALTVGTSFKVGTTSLTESVLLFGAGGPSLKEIKMEDRAGGGTATIISNGYGEVLIGRSDAATINVGNRWQSAISDFPEAAAPATPAANNVRLYAKADGLLYSKDDAGVETAVSGIGGGTTAQFNAALSDNDFATLAGTESLTNKRITPRVTSITSNATWSPSADTDDMYIVTAQAAAVTTISNPSGTPTVGQKLVIRVKDDGTARALTWSGSQWRASTDLALPTTTTLGKTMYLGFIWNGVDSKWDLIAKLDNF